MHQNFSGGLWPLCEYPGEARVYKRSGHPGQGRGWWPGHDMPHVGCVLQLGTSRQDYYRRAITNANHIDYTKKDFEKTCAGTSRKFQINRAGFQVNCSGFQNTCRISSYFRRVSNKCAAFQNLCSISGKILHHIMANCIICIVDNILVQKLLQNVHA